MNPSAFQMSVLRYNHEVARRIEEKRRAELHAAAVKRRRKAKRGGPR